MKVWPFGAALWGEASNCHLLRWLKTVVVSEVEKASQEASGRDQEDERERIADDVSLMISSGIKTGAVTWARDRPGGVPTDWPGGVRHGGDVSLICCSRRERGKACPDTAALVRVVRGSVSSGGTVRD
jgi:hypothetical protein